MARTYRTLSLSVPPEVAERLAERGLATGKTAARVAAEVVLREDKKREAMKDKTVHCLFLVVPGAQAVSITNNTEQPMSATALAIPWEDLPERVQALLADIADKPGGHLEVTLSKKKGN